MRVSPSRCSSCSSRPTMRAASERRSAASSTPDVHRSGSALAPDAAPASAPVRAAKVSALPGTDAAVVMARTGSPAKALTTARAAATVDSACWSSDTVGEHRGEIERGARGVGAADQRRDRVCDDRRRVDRLRRRVGDGSIERRDHRAPHRIVREEQAGGDGAAQRAFAERPGSRLEPRQTCRAVARRWRRSPCPGRAGGERERRCDR